MSVSVSECQCIAPGCCESEGKGKEGKKRGIITCFMFMQTKQHKTKPASDSVYKQFLKEKREIKEMHTTAWGKGE